MNDSLPEEVDVIIVGTGLSESVLSGALSRINRSVLHLDPEEYYGGSWASFNINSFDELMKSNDVVQETTDLDVPKHLEENENFIPIQPRTRLRHCESRCFLSRVVQQRQTEETNPATGQVDPSLKENLEHLKTNSSSGDDVNVNAKDNEPQDIPDVGQPIKETKDGLEADIDEKTGADDIVDDEFSTDKSEPSINKREHISLKSNLSPYDEFYSLWRQFNIDLTCKVIFSRGLLVELLIQSNVSRYLEFRNVSRLLTLMKDSLQPVPCTRADVFKSKLVSVVQKRFLMRVLTTCANADQHPAIEEEFKDKLFVDFLTANKLCEESQHFVIHSIAMVDKRVPVMDGVRATRTFLKSLGRFGNSAFLFPSYGVGEIPQAFSRLSAVFGGVFCLRRFAVGLIVDRETGQCKGIIDSKGQRIRCRYLVLDETNAPDRAKKDFETTVPRAVYITDRSLMPSSIEHVTLISLPPSEKNCPIRLVEAGPATSVCPKNYYLVHATAEVSTDDSVQPQSVFSPIEDLLFVDGNTDDSLPSTSDVEEVEGANKPKLLWRAYFSMGENGVEHDQLPSNVFITSGPGGQLGFDSAMIEARKIFEIICPDEEFLPRAPEPEEIIFNDEGYNTEKNGNSSSEELDDNRGGEYGEEEDEEGEESRSEEQAPSARNEPIQESSDQQS